MTSTGPICNKCQSADDLLVERCSYTDALVRVLAAVETGGLTALTAMRDTAHLVHDQAWVDAADAVAEAVAEAVRNDQHLVDGRMFTFEELRDYQRERYLAAWASNHWGSRWEEDPGREEVDILFDYWLDMGRIGVAETAGD